jgi:hypothetical protein
LDADFVARRWASQLTKQEPGQFASIANCRMESMSLAGPRLASNAQCRIIRHLHAVAHKVDALQDKGYFPGEAFF